MCKSLLDPFLHDGSLVQTSLAERHTVVLASALLLHLTEMPTHNSQHDDDDAGSNARRVYRLLGQVTDTLGDIQLPQERKGDATPLYPVWLACAAELARVELSKRSYRGVRDLPWYAYPECTCGKGLMPRLIMYMTMVPCLLCPGLLSAWRASLGRTGSSASSAG